MTREDLRGMKWHARGRRVRDEGGHAVARVDAVPGLGLADLLEASPELALEAPDGDDPQV